MSSIKDGPYAFAVVSSAAAAAAAAPMRAVVSTVTLGSARPAIV
jgi:hypothetical protein